MDKARAASTQWLKPLGIRDPKALDPVLKFRLGYAGWAAENMREQVNGDPWSAAADGGVVGEHGDRL